MPDGEPYQIDPAFHAYLRASDEQALFYRRIVDLANKGDFPMDAMARRGRIWAAKPGKIHKTFLRSTFGDALIDIDEPALPPALYDFILVFHPFRPPAPPLGETIRDWLGYLTKAGELWLALPMHHGAATIRDHVGVYHLTFWQVLQLIRPLLSPCFKYQVETLDSSLAPIDFAAPSTADKLRLAYILGLDQPFDALPEAVRVKLAALTLGNGQQKRIPNPTGILRLRRSC